MRKIALLFLLFASACMGAPMTFQPATLDDAIAQMTAKGFGTISVDEIPGITTDFSKSIKKDKGFYFIDLEKESQTSASVWIEASTKRGHAVDYDAGKLQEKLKVLGFEKEKEGDWKLDAGAITATATFGTYATSLTDDTPIKKLRIEFRYRQPSEQVKLWE